MAVSGNNTTVAAVAKMFVDYFNTRTASYFQLQMEMTNGSTLGPVKSCTISVSGSLAFTVTATPFNGVDGAAAGVDKIRLYYDALTTNWLEIPLSQTYTMNDTGYELDLQSFNITLSEPVV